MKRDDAFTQRLMQSLYHISRCRHATFQSMLANYGVTLHQFHLLLYIVQRSKVKVSNVSEKMLVSMPTASRMINTLCDMDLVVKKKESGDRRSTYLELTPKGRKIVKDIRAKQLAMVSGILAKMPEEDAEAFLRVTEKIADEWMFALRGEAPGD